MKTSSLRTFGWDLIIASIVIVMAFSLALPAEAKTKTTLVKKDVSTLVEEIKNIQKLVEQRTQFNLKGPAVIAVRPEYFALNFAADSVQTIAGDNVANISINTDGGVSQIMILSKCSEVIGVLTLGQSNTCVEKTWVSKYTEANGVRNFSIPVGYTSEELEASLNFSAYACRYNGCMFEKNFSIQYKDKLSLADTLRIYDRYEWTYEWDNKIYHVQEVLLSFPYKDVRRVKLIVRCDVAGLYISTEDDNRATCNNRRSYGQPDFRDYTTDDQGNAFNLKIESLTKNIQEENVGAVTMEFTFIGKQNQVIYKTTHKPIQLDVEEEEEDEEKED